MNKRNLIVALFATMAFGIAVAGDKPPPPTKDRICTIGWYKNKGFDTWYTTCLEADGAAVCDALNDAMYTTGPHAGDAKNAAADTIVATYVGFGNESCEID